LVDYASGVVSLESRLADFLKSDKDWERKPTTVPGVFVLRMPPFKGIPARLAVELNPVDEAGRPTKKRGEALRAGSGESLPHST
jgi:hypothetical protein